MGAGVGMHFGEHITIDGYGGCQVRLDDAEFVRSCIDDLCNLLAMKRLSDTVVVSAPDNGGKDPGGWSGFVVIAESHVSVHTFPKRRFLSADVYSCQNGIDVNRIICFFKKTFALADVETRFIKRGTRYPAQNVA